MNIVFFASLGIFFATGCATTEPQKDPERVAVVPPVTKPNRPNPNKVNRPEQEGVVDLEGIKQALGMQRGAHELGYTEKIFENCGGKFGFPRSTSCQNLYYILIHFKIQCRDSEGTVSEVITEDQLTPFANQKIKWSMKSLQGETKTDRGGYGQIQTLSTSSQREQRLKLLGGNDFLYMAAGEIKRVVTPRNWCQ